MYNIILRITLWLCKYSKKENIVKNKTKRLIK